MNISIVVPVYNSTETLEVLAEEIDGVFRSRPDDAYELIFVDDSSSLPGTWPTIAALTARFPQVRAVQLSRNFGQQAATLCGLRAATGDFIITMDDDLQHDPQDIPRFLERTDSEIVIGQFSRKQHSWFKRVTSRLKGVFDRIIVAKPKGIQLSAFRMLSRSVVDGILSMRTPNPFLPALMFHVSRDVAGVEVSHNSRDAGKSGYSLRKLIRLFNDLLINNSSLLLRGIGVIGIAIAVASFGLAADLVYRQMRFGIPVKGWASLMVATLLIGGLLLISVGVIGDYLIRIIQSSEERPTYLVRRRAGFPDRRES